ncbi:uncharacterized protein WCC33_007489 isoform 2-T2 [Rhinophrynus dorsalis]
MAISPISLLVGALCVILVPGVLADDCAPYVDSQFVFHRGQTCVLSFCSGTCVQRYCSIIPGLDLDQSQFLCVVTNLWFVVGAGIVIFLLIIIGVITCICKSFCALCNLCCPKPQYSSHVAVTNVMPRQPMVPVGAMAMSPPMYQPVPSQPNKGVLPPPYPAAENMAFVEYP